MHIKQGRHISCRRPFQRFSTIILTTNILKNMPNCLLRRSLILLTKDEKPQIEVGNRHRPMPLKCLTIPTSKPLRNSSRYSKQLIKPYKLVSNWYLTYKTFQSYGPRLLSNLHIKPYSSFVQSRGRRHRSTIKCKIGYSFNRGYTEICKRQTTN